MKALSTSLLAVLLASSIFGFTGTKGPQGPRTLKVSLRSEGYFDQLNLCFVEGTYVAEIRHTGTMLAAVKGEVSLEGFREIFSEARALTGTVNDKPNYVELALETRPATSPKLASFIATVNQKLLLESGLK